MLIPFYALGALLLIFRGDWILRLKKHWQSLLDEAQDCRLICWLRGIPFLRLLDALIIAVLVLICLHGTDVPDFRNYQTAYSRMSLGIPYSYLGRGWYVLMNIGLTLGMSYAQVRAVLALFCLLALSSTADYYRSSDRGKLMFWGLYMIFPALLDFTQIRFFCAIAFVIYAFRWLDDFSIRNCFLYAFFTLLGALIHSSALLYLALLLVHLFRRFPKSMSAAVTGITLCAVLFREPLIHLGSALIRSDRLERYILQGSPIGSFGLLFTAAFSAGICLLLLMQLRLLDREYPGRIRRTPSRAPLSEIRIRKGLYTALGVNVLLCGVIALSRLDANFFRLERPGWIFFIMISSSICSLSADKRFSRPKKTADWLWAALLLLAVAANLYFISLFTFPLVLGYLG